jgi:hypothetical protein
MSGEEMRLHDYLQKNWQPPVSTTDAVSRILRVASQTSQQSAQVQRPLRISPVWGLAMAASFAAAMIWMGVSPKPVSPDTQFVQRSPLDEEALTYVFSNQSSEELL